MTDSARWVAPCCCSSLHSVKAASSWPALPQAISREVHTSSDSGSPAAAMRSLICTSTEGLRGMLSCKHATFKIHDHKH